MSSNEFTFASRRSPVYGRSGMVATSQPLAVAAGLEILRLGGSAADAAVATAAALNVTEPTSTGIGGDCFALYFENKTRNIYALNGSGRSPAGLDLKLVQQRGFSDSLPPFHPLTITVPGACAGWCDLVSRFGKLDLHSVLQPAINLAQEGFPVAPITAYFWDRGVERQLSIAEGGEALTIDGRAPKAGEIFQNRGLARTFQAIADGGRNVFYEGPIADSIVSVMQAVGGVLTLQDLATHQSNWEQPIMSSYRGYQVVECPPNGQGLVALLALNILEGFDLHEFPTGSAERIHVMAESLRAAFSDGRHFICDPSINHIPVDELLSKDYATIRRKSISLMKSNPNWQPGPPFSSSDTVYLSVVDSEGNACSFINSNYMGFGTGIVPGGWGFTLQNRGHSFSLDPTHMNAVGPRKRPYHTIIPALLLNQDGSLFSSFGVMGGFMQPQGHLQVAVALIDDGFNPQVALDCPRFCLPQGQADDPLALEQGIPAEVGQRLENMGHLIRYVHGYGRALFGRGQIIHREGKTGVLCGASDPRADGMAGVLL